LFDNIAAIDIGTSSIKVLAVRTGLRDFQIKSLLYEEFSLETGMEDDYLKYALEKIGAELDLSGYSVVTSLPMQNEITRHITFPFNDPQKIASALPFEAEENIPFDMNDMIIDFQHLAGKGENEGRVLLAAVKKSVLRDSLAELGDNDVAPARVVQESSALFECYRYFNTMQDESVIQLDIGHTKTILNIISSNRLLYTRAIKIGTGMIHSAAAEIMKTDMNEARSAVEKLSLDVTSLDNNLQRAFYSALGLNRQKLRRIFNAASDVIDELTEEIRITLKAFNADYGSLEFSRVLLSGGGAAIQGLGQRISEHIDAPAVPLPFLPDYSEQKVRNQFPLAFGIMLSYLYPKRAPINFLRGEFNADAAGTSRKIYYLAGVFAGLSVLVLILNLVLSAVFTIRSNNRYNRILQEKYVRYFRTKTVSDDPLKDAEAILKKERGELDKINLLIPENGTIMDLLRNIISYFPGDPDFELKSMVINERVVRIDGSAGSSRMIDEFKQGLDKSGSYESVTVNIRGSQKQGVIFTMTIKQKLQGKR